MQLKQFLLAGVATLSFLAQPQTQLFAANHREAPITALDTKADITDWYAFVSPRDPSKAVLILNVDPFLEPSNGPNYFPFDPNILYEMKIDNDRDGRPDVTFRFRFKTDIRLPNVFTGFVGGLAGIPPITALDGPGSDGLSLRQSYTVAVFGKGYQRDLSYDKTLYAVPTNVGPRTMPNYPVLRSQGVYDLGGGVRVFAGTVADPFFIDLGAAFDSLNFRSGAGGGVLSPNADTDDTKNYAPNALAGFNVNTIVLEVPITMLTRDAKLHVASEKDAVIGTWGTTSRKTVSTLKKNYDEVTDDLNYRGESWSQVQRMGHPLINELIIGTGSKNRFSMEEPYNDGKFANYFLNPLLATIFGSIGIPVAPGPRTDLLPLVQYMAPICPGCGANDGGPIADLLRLNTGITPITFFAAKRLGFLAGDTAGYPNGRRPNDDVVDIASRVVAGILVNGTKYGTRIGDGVNTAPVPAGDVFPYLAPAYSGRDSAHAGPGQAGCDPQPGGICPVQ